MVRMPEEFRAFFPWDLPGPVIVKTDDHEDAQGNPVATIIAIVTALSAEQLVALGLEELEIEKGFDLLEVHFGPDGQVVCAMSCMAFAAAEQGLLSREETFDELIRGELSGEEIEEIIAKTDEDLFNKAVARGDAIAHQARIIQDAAWAELMKHKAAHKAGPSLETIIRGSAFVGGLLFIASVLVPR